MSTLKVDGIRSNSASSDAITLASNGTCTANLSSVNGGAIGTKNLIINGGMDVAERGVSSTTSGYGSVDRFHIQYDGGTVTHTQTAITSGSPYDNGFRNVLKLTNTATGSGTGNYRNPFQYIEAQNIATSGWNYASSSSFITLSFWVRSSVAQEFYGYLRTFDGTDEQAYCFSTGSLSANTWTKVTKTISGNSNITINNDNGAGLQVNIAPFWGGDFTTSGKTTDAWAAFNSSSRTPDYANTWANTAGATFELTGVQLEVGSTASNFAFESYAETLRKCQRYYVKFQGDVTAFRIGMGYVLSTTSAFIYAHLPVPMRTKPTTIDTNGTPANYSVHTAAMNSATSLTVHTQSTPNLGIVNLIGTGFPAGEACHLRPANNTAFIGLGCEL